MDRPTDFRFVVRTYLSTAAGAWASVRAMTAEWVCGAVIMGASVLGVLWWSVFLWCSYADAWGQGTRDIIDTRRRHDAADGTYASADAVPPCPTPTIVRLASLLAVPALAIVWCVWLHVWRAKRRREAYRGSLVSWPTLMGEAKSAVHLYLAYPDADLNAPGGWDAVWTPATHVHQRRSLVAQMVAGIRLSAVAGLATGVWIIGMGLWLPAWVVAVLLLTHWAACIAAWVLAPHLVHEQVAIAWRPVMEQQVQLLAESETDWEHNANLVKHSTFKYAGVRLCDHLYIGDCAPRHSEWPHLWRDVSPCDYAGWVPALLHRRDWTNHFHITGPTQMGKTTLGTIGVLKQVLRGQPIWLRDAEGLPVLGVDGMPLEEGTEHMPVIIIDCKGDEVLRNTVKEECERRGRVYRQFTLEPGKASAYFNALGDLLRRGQCSLVLLCELICGMLGLFHGMQYGRGYYSKTSRDQLLRALKDAPTPPTSWASAYRVLMAAHDPREDRDVFELLSTIRAIAEFEVLGPAPEGAEEISMVRAIAENEVIYFHLPALGPAYTVRDVGRMAMYCWLQAAIARSRGPEGPKRSLMVIDEFQILAGEQSEVVLQQASAGSVTCLFSNQSLHDLDRYGVPNLSDTVRDNTRVKLAFGIPNLKEAEDWARRAGETIVMREGWSVHDSGTTFSYSPSVGPRMPLDVITQATNEPNTALLLSMTDSGLCRYRGRPVRLRVPYTMTEEEYERRQNTPWEASTAASPASTATATKAPGSPFIGTRSPEQVVEDAQRDYSRIEEMFKSLVERIHGKDKAPKKEQP